MFANSIDREADRNPIWQETGGALRVPVTAVPIRNANSKAATFKGGWDEWRIDAGEDGYRWGGQAMTWNPGSGLLAFRLHVTATGDYRLALRSRSAPGSEGCFVRIDGGQWWITLGAARGDSTGDWSWETAQETAPGVGTLWTAALAEGFHLVEISGRAPGFRVSDLALWRGEGDPAAIPPAGKRPR